MAKVGKMLRRGKVAIEVWDLSFDVFMTFSRSLPTLAAHYSLWLFESTVNALHSLAWSDEEWFCNFYVNIQFRFIQSCEWYLPTVKVLIKKIFTIVIVIGIYDVSAAADKETKSEKRSAKKNKVEYPWKKSIHFFHIFHIFSCFEYVERIFVIL